MDYSKIGIRQLHEMVQIVKRSYMSTVNALTREQCIFILDRLPIPTKDKVDILKKTIPKKDSKDDEYDF
jgi:hypothetical protein